LTAEEVVKNQTELKNRICRSRERFSVIREICLGETCF